MADKTPIRLVLDGSNPTGIAEYQSGETIPVASGGTGLSSLGTAGYFLRTNEAGTALEYASVVSQFTLTGDDSSDVTFSTGQTLRILGDTGITAAVTDAGDSGAILTIDLDDTAVTPGSYGSSTAVPQITVDQQGRITSLSTAAISTSFTLAADSGSNDTFNTGDTLTISGTANEIETAVTDNTITIGLPNDVTIGNDLTVTGNLTVNGTTTTINSTTVDVVNSFRFEGATDDGFETNLTVVDPTADRTINLPNASGTIVLKDTTDTLTNKSIDLANNTLTGSLAEFNSALQSESFAGLAATQTLTNKTINTASNTITVVEADISDLQSYILAGSTDTLTNKTIDANSNTLSNIGNSSLSNSTITLGSSTLTLGATTTTIAGVTELTVDNLNVNANTISSTDSNGNIILDPNGSGTVDVNSSRITSVTDPTSDQDAATKAYVDSVANGLDVKDSCAVATAAALAACTYNNGAGTLTADANGALSVDGVTVSVDDRILVKDQASAVQNGIYKVTATGGASAAFVLTRSPDADTASELTGGTFFFVESGTANADNGYVATHNGTPTFGTTDITFAQFSGAGQISAGAALSKTGNQLDVEVDDSSIEVSSDALQVKALGITNAMLAGSIANAKLSNSTVSFGGISLALGATDATPAFDLSDATNYPASSLSGTVANNQLANNVISFTDDSSTSVSVGLGQSLSILGGEGIDATISGGILNIIGELATTSNKGVASFSSDNFTVTSGAVTVTTIDGGTF